MKNLNISRVEQMLRVKERDCVTACGRFLSYDPLKDNLWLLNGKNGEHSALLINSRSAFIPVLSGNDPDVKRQIPQPVFLKKFLLKRKIHSVQGIKEDVLFLENELEKMGAKTAEIVDYELMELDKQPDDKGYLSGPPNLVMRTPKLTDLDELAVLHAGYEKEEVLPKGSVFSPAASRVKIANIIAGGQILAAQICGRLVGKINVNAVSFTRYQIGGVYVHPDFRGLGIARRMTAEFITSFIAEGRGITLFVRKSNAAARRVYASLGFSPRRDYRITYY
ncbi:MAG: GNAT family N-acetyltransferase [Treponema sp.]|jgi:ribosomal protein S18 acetylase RimI-like enzyme|nr:GNAT family N-acetyltransferase [Treponema sp.]